MSSNNKSTTVNVYLLKDVENPKDAIRQKFLDDNRLKWLEEEYGLLSHQSIAYMVDETSKPPWLESFFLNELTEINFKSKNLKLILFSKVVVEENDMYFAVTFGYGRTMLKRNKYVINFGRRITANLLGGAKVRGVTVRPLGTGAALRKEQGFLPGPLSMFDVSETSDFLAKIELIVGGDYFSIATGKNAFRCSSRIDYTEIDSLLKHSYQIYSKTNYIDDGYEFLDFIAPIEEMELIDVLDQKLIDKMENEPEKVGFSQPDIVEDVVEFSVGTGRNQISFDIPTVESYMEYLRKINKSLSVKTLNTHKLKGYFSDFDSDQEWKIYRCLSIEVEHDGSIFYLFNGEWHTINYDYIEETTSRYNKIERCEHDFPPLDHKVDLRYIEKEDKHIISENEYNKRLADGVENYLYMEDSPVKLTGKDKIELCDVFDLNAKSFIHVKRYRGISSISDLYRQAHQSFDYITDPTIKERFQGDELNDLPDVFCNVVKSTKSNSDFHVLLLITSKNVSLELSFLSKLALVELDKYFKKLNVGGFCIKIMREIPKEAS